ncbi:manganese/zinc/iron transport system substrate-binding protein [Roseinatronobacter thiooxidans]|uniref:Manganese/zinc/iron transport system substrate-binding protein n=1 Tax=Roseinatronobacter thiooxidans TaxID=121821 RepID=A0A2W7QBL7_9RHOB|nr:zinc ABC transporter substrate-binding protein [Roseinatronobacter thiooxidans]PZX45543.1 manganese/zinc/iron transport system substrate-binding protein [Roseinatronobacter thiooxidans]
MIRTKVAIIASCAAFAAPANAQDGPLNVLATVGMVADVAQNVAGACANVTTLIGAGTDPHYFSATPRDVDALAQAELIFYVDRALEERLADVLDNFRNRTPTVGLAGASFDTDALLQDPDADGALDPHLWMDVSRWAQIAPVIAENIAQLRPDCAADLARNVADYTAQLDALHRWVGDAIATIPEGQRMLVTAHDAFYYFADAYGIEASEAIEGISTASEASIGDIREVAGFVIERGVPAVFVETTINPRTIEALVAEVQAQGHDVVIGGALFSDAMGDTGTAEGTYIGMIRANTATVTTALGGTLPDWPEVLQDWAQEWDISD